MKKLVSMILVMVMAVTLLAACGSSDVKETTPVTQETAPVETTGTEAPAESTPVEDAPAADGSAVSVLETVWNLYGEDEKFPVMGGSAAAFVDGKPGNFDLADESITGVLLIPAEQLSNVTSAASVVHMMNANTFTGGAFQLAEGVAAADFAAAMKDAVVNNQFVCGFPEELLIQEIDGQYVVAAFGAADLLDVFSAHLMEAYPQATVLVEEVIA